MRKLLETESDLDLTPDFDASTELGEGEQPLENPPLDPN
jgi:hypothetical protein